MPMLVDAQAEVPSMLNYFFRISITCRLWQQERCAWQCLKVKREEMNAREHICGSRIKECTQRSALGSALFVAFPYIDQM